MKILPKLHLLLPTYNRSHILESTLENVMNQDCHPAYWQITVVDNNSTDNTIEILSKYSKIYNNFDYVINESNIGLFGNLNRCIDLSRTKKFMIIHSDDSVEINLVSRAIYIAEMLPDAGLIFGQSKVYISENDELLQNWYSSDIFTKGIYKINNTSFMDALLSSGSTFFFAPSVIYDKDFFGDDLRYSLDYSFSSDLDLWMRAALKKGNIGIYDKPLVTCHIHQDRLSEMHAKKMRLEYIDVCSKYLELIENNPQYHNLSKNIIILIKIKLLIFKFVIKNSLVPGFKARRKIATFFNKLSK